ncbi:hypothetical protein [Aeromonas sp. QDB04]|nr:hypothetical protein [Aeromonas sp. QDB04]
MDNKINSSAALWNAANEKLTEKIHSQDGFDPIGPDTFSRLGL